MAGRAGSDREQLLQKAQEVSDMLRQLKSAAQGSGGSRGGGRSRGRWQPHHHTTDVYYQPAQDNFTPPEQLVSPRGPAHHQQPRGRGQYRPRGKRGHPNPDNWRDRSSRSSSEEAGGIDPYTMVDIIIKCPDFSASLLQLLEEHNLPPKMVRDFVSQYCEVFSLNGEALELTPQVELCVEHAGPAGCQRRSSCTKLHMCPSFILNYCQDETNCVLGHRWHTDHNLRILKQFYMNYARFPALRTYFRSVLKKQEASAQAIDVCKKYNEGGCGQSCGSLHVCLSFVLGLTRCSRTKCRLNHNLLSPQCSQLLQSCGLPTNEAPRDIVMAILQANPSLSHSQKEGPASQAKTAGDKDKRQQKENKEKSNVKSDKPEGNKSSRKKSSKSVKQADEDTSSESEARSSGKENSSGSNRGNDSEENTGRSETKDKTIKLKSKWKNSKNVKQTDESSSSDEEEDSSGSNRGSGSQEKTKKKSEAEDKSTKQKSQRAVEPVAKVEVVRTQWSHYLQGDTKVPQICYYSVESLCRYEGSGCQRLHSTQHFHWQLKDQARWINLRPSQVMCLEKAYCDPAEEGVDLPRLDPAQLERSLSGLLIMLGRDVWHATFATMTLTNSSKSKSLGLRRLCTEAVTGQVVKPATFLWYFLDKNNKWVQYGNVDTAGETNLVSSVTSQDIENHYVQNATSPLTFKNSKFTYTLDFTTMKQTNQNTRVSRDVRRRPEPHLAPDKPSEEKDKKTDQSFPGDWEVMQPGERMRLVTLASSSAEYKGVIGLLGGRVSSSLVVKVERIQNPFLWRAFQNKVTELAAIYGDDGKADVRQLFHGTAHNVVASICSENFDWRLHGSASGQVYGRGTYFATDAAYSYNYCKPDPSGMKFLFVAKVAVGSFTTGSSSMVRPPINPATAHPYDSTVNNTTTPTIIVKYDKQEYYPEFVITLS